MTNKLFRKSMLLHKIFRVFYVITLFSVIFFISDVNAAYFKYKDFDPEIFYKARENYWENINDNNRDNPENESLLKDQLKFYTKLYKELALYEDRGYYIDDNIIIATYNEFTSAKEIADVQEYQKLTQFHVDTAAVVYDPREDKDLKIEGTYYCEPDNNNDDGVPYDCSVDPPKGQETDKETDSDVSLWGAIVKWFRDKLKVIFGGGESGEGVISDSIEENDFLADEEGTKKNYYSEDFDTIILLIRNMLSYKTSCYLIRSEVKIGDINGDGEAEEYCENEEDQILEIPQQNGRGFMRFLPKKRRCGQLGEYYQPHFKYYTSKKENSSTNAAKDRSYLDRATGKTELPEAEVELYLDERYIDPYYEACKSEFEEDESYTAFKYIYEGEDSVNTNYFFDFLVSTRYFDQKVQFNMYFNEILNDANVDCLTNEVCSKSLESVGLYDEYKHEIIQTRYYIVKLIIGMLNDYGANIIYTPDPLLGLIDENSIRNCYGFLWPSGSVETTTSNGKTYAIGTPTSTRITSNFGRRSAPTKGASDNHQGIDIGQATGTHVIASKAGVVTKSGWASGYGYVIYIQHENGYETRYGHNSQLLVNVGDYVDAGQVIALAGSTGISTGAHIHFEVRINGEAQNPINYVSTDNSSAYCDTEGTSDESGGAGCNISNPCGSKTSENAKQAVCTALKSAGYSNVAIGGIMTNIESESGFRTCAFNCSGGNLGAFGIAQWRANRQSGLTSLPGFETARVQAQYLISEAPNNNCSPSQMNNSKLYTDTNYSIEVDPAYIWCVRFERPGESTCRSRASSKRKTTALYATYAANGCV